MFLLHRPTEEEVRRFIIRQASARLSYPEVGASRAAEPPPGYAPNYRRVQVGSGDEALHRARAAVRRWAMYDMDWIDVLWPDTPIETGRTMGLRIRHFGFWSLNACRIVYVEDEATRFGFGYGTLEGHAQRGEERFTVELDEHGDVWYELYSFSRPGAWLVRLGYLLGRGLQRQFATESARAMQRAVELA
jgi:uncharacterized protein (UPF0548 family)